jgi:hypothetical protein
MHGVMICHILCRKNTHINTKVSEKNPQNLRPRKSSLGFLPKWVWLLQDPYQICESNDIFNL